MFSVPFYSGVWAGGGGGLSVVCNVAELTYLMSYIHLY